MSPRLHTALRYFGFTMGCLGIAVGVALLLLSLPFTAALLLSFLLLFLACWFAAKPLKP